MAVPIGVAEAAAVLQDHFGARLEADYDDGRHEMVDALRQHFRISAREARRLVDELEHARTIRWRPGSRANTALGEPSNALGGIGAGTGMSGTASPAALGGMGEHLVPMHPGSYWQLEPPD
ncbi:MAG TPA: hypothetical protein VFZ66_21990 [Herpetosiphonaceae bacterium]